MINFFLKRMKKQCARCHERIDKIFIWDNGIFYCSIKCLMISITGIEQPPEPPQPQKEIANRNFLKAYNTGQFTSRLKK